MGFSPCGTLAHAIRSLLSLFPQPVQAFRGAAPAYRKPARLSRSGSVLIWILAFGFIFCGCYAQRLHPFQPPIDKASVQVLKVLDLLPLHAVQKLDISSDNEYLPPSIQLADIDHAFSRKWKRAVIIAFSGNKSKVAINLELPYRVNIGSEFEFDAFDRYQVIGFVQNFKLNHDLAGIFESTRNIYTQRHNIDPLTQSGRLKRNLLFGRLSRLASLPGLPDYAPQREQKEPSSYSFRPCQDYVPPVPAGMALLCILAGLYFTREFSRSRGWYAGLCAFYVVALTYCVALLIVNCHRNSCDKQDSNSGYRQPLQHNSAIVPQKYLDSL